MILEQNCEIPERVSTNVTGRTKTICCKKVYHLSEILCKYKSKKPKPAAKNFLRQKKVIIFLSKYETLSNRNDFVLFSTLASLIVEVIGNVHAIFNRTNKLGNLSSSHFVIAFANVSGQSLEATANQLRCHGRSS